MVKALLDNQYLIRELVARDIHTRYVGSLMGLFWSILNPLVQLILYTVIFSMVLELRFDQTDSSGRFALYLFCALLPWMALQESVTRSSRTFIENHNLIKKVRFPLEVLPFSVVFSAFVHQCIRTGILLVVLVVYGALNYPLAVLILPIFAVQLGMMYGLSVTVACLNVFFRDIAQILGVAFMFFFWLTPIVYPKHRAKGLFLWILDANPLTHLVEAHRYVLLGNPIPSLWGLVYCVLFSLIVFWLGVWVLSRTRQELVDLI